MAQAGTESDLRTIQDEVNRREIRALEENDEAVPEFLRQWSKDGRAAIEDGRPWDVPDLDLTAEELGLGDLPLPPGVRVDSSGRYRADGIGKPTRSLGSFGTRREASRARELEERRLSKGPFKKHPTTEEEEKWL